MRKLCHFAQHDILILRSNLLFVAMVIDHPRTLEQWRAGNVNAAGHQLPWKRPQGIQTLGQTTAKPCPQCRLHMPIGIISFEYFPGWEHFMRVLISCALLIFFFSCWWTRLWKLRLWQRLSFYKAPGKMRKELAGSPHPGDNHCPTATNQQILAVPCWSCLLAPLFITYNFKNPWLCN